MRSIILRFSDAELEGTPVNTVEAHSTIILASPEHSTWWGWWKKKHEIFPGELLEYVDQHARAKGLRVGLVNTKAGERLFFAECHGLHPVWLTPA